MPRFTVTGATGRIGSGLVRALLARGDGVTVLSRRPERARAVLPGVEAVAWEPSAGPAPAEALAGRDGVVHLAGEDLAQRWSPAAKRRILESRELGTRHLVDGLRACEPRPRVLASASGVGYYRDCGDEPQDEDSPAGDDFQAQVCVAWEREASAAEALDMAVARVRTGIALDREGGALARMLPFFRLGVGGPVAGGRQYLSWVHRDDVTGIYLAALDGAWSGPVNATAPQPVTNREFSWALGRALRRPALAPVPGLALRALYGQMAELVLDGRYALPRRTRELGYEFTHPQLDEALRSTLA